MEVLKTFALQYDVLLILISVMLISGVLKETNAGGSLYSLVSRCLKSPKWLLAMFSAFLGIVPIPGRIVATCGVLDSLRDKTKESPKMGIVAYLSSHHYYLWSPLEKSIIITCGVLGLTYYQFMSYMLIPALIAFIFCMVYIGFFVKQDEINFGPVPLKVDGRAIFSILVLIGVLVAGACQVPMLPLMGGCAVLLMWVNRKKINFKKVHTFLDWKLLLVAVGALLLSSVVGFYSKPILDFVNSHAGQLSLPAIVCLSFFASFLMGSSAKFAAMTGALCLIYGLQYLPLFYLVDYCGYLVSPSHKCLPIAQQYFKTPVLELSKVLGIEALILTVYGTIAIILG